MLLKSMPAFTRHFGIRPWELEQFTMDELNTYLRALDEHFRQLRTAAANNRRSPQGQRRRR